MTLKQAIEICEKHQYLKCTKSKTTGQEIFDVVVIPDNNVDLFLGEYEIEKDFVGSNTIQKYPSKSYSVIVLSELDAEEIDYCKEDISLYLDTNSSVM